MRFLSFLYLALLVSLAGQASEGVVRADDPADGERDFVEQLRTQQFYDLAEQFCIRRSEQCRTPDARAYWQMLLADCREQHAWSLLEPGRSQLLSHATEGITQFIRQETPAPEPDLLLRVRQIELLSAIVKIDAKRLEFGPASAPNSLALQAMKEGLQLAEAMVEQIDQIRRDIEGGVAREARERTRYVVAELLLFEARQNPADDLLRKRAIAAAEQLAKSSGDSDVGFNSRSLLAESSLDRKDFEGFDLLMISLTSLAKDQTQKNAVAALKIRGLLKREQPSEALQYCLDLEKQSLRSREISTLRLASLLHLFELLHKLDAAELRKKTSDEFHLMKQRLNSATKGVWRERCDRIALRFRRVEKFGPEAATAIESVTDLIAAGDYPAARKTLLTMQSAFERDSPQIAGTLAMHSGDLAIRLRDWKSAAGDLDKAASLFRTAGNRDREAASDLLRVYALGQQWDAETSDDIQVRNSQEAAYRDSLQQHLAEYSDQTTSAKAHEWHAMLLRATDPVAAAEELLRMADGSPEKDLMLLVQSGEILIESVLNPHVQDQHIDQNQLTETIRIWTEKTATLVGSSAIAEAASGDKLLLHVLEIQRMAFSLRRRWSAQDDWQKLATDVRHHLDAIATLDAAGINDATDLTRNDVESSGAAEQTGKSRSHLEAANAIGYPILGVAACRQLLGDESIKESRNFLMKMTPERRSQAVGLLLWQASDTSHPTPGDPQLGLMALELLRDEKLPASAIDSQLAQLPMLFTASKAAGNFQYFDAIINDLTMKPLNDTQLQKIAAILRLRSGTTAVEDAPSETAKRLWKSVLERSRPGEDQWLEASLQLAIIAVSEKKNHEAEKVLNVINALYPEWGTPERQERAAALKARLESTQ